MDTGKNGESSRSSGSDEETPISPTRHVSLPIAPRQVHVQSSAALLHHLHTDPRSNHITLSASTARQAAPTLRGPRAATLPLRSDKSAPGSVVGKGKARDTSRPSEAIAPTSGTGSTPQDAPPRAAMGSLGRSGSGRFRPRTAPSTSASEIPTIRSASSKEASPEIPSNERMEEATSTASETRQLTEMANSDDMCISGFAQDELDYMRHAADMAGAVQTPQVERATDGNGERRTIVGRAGTLLDQPTSSLQLYEHVPPGQAGFEAIGWDEFSRKYTSGLFDPNKIPHPPVKQISPSYAPSAKSSPGAPIHMDLHHGSLHAVGKTMDNTSSSDTQTNSSSGGSASTLGTVASSAPSTSAALEAPPVPSVPVSIPMANVPKVKSKELENLPTRPIPLIRPDTKLHMPSYNYAAASMHLATTSSGYSRDAFAPLGMPSPDKELVDPLASVIGGDRASSDPSNSRFPLSRSMTSAIDKDRIHFHDLPTIQASPASTPSHEYPPNTAGLARRQSSPSRVVKGGLAATSRIPAATAPLHRTIEASGETDYFGSAVSPPEHPHFDRQASHTSNSSSSQTVTSHPTPTTGLRPSPPPRYAKDDTVLPKLVNKSQLKELYDKLGFLPAALPPDEEARRKALYKFNLLHTGKDVNFDRIAHMTKLVFGTKIVIINLIEGEIQWNKSDNGLGVATSERSTSFCSHAILGRSDEPFVVLDTTLDWRFAKNPNVVGGPHIRFYAGAPLRTAEGYNIGTLCIIDDKPRTEFPPRQRMILKEFAAVTMREMELWRDKLRLKVRDKIQSSMENFTRECLEMDVAATASHAEANAHMDKVYSRATQLICSTLDMEESTILDISQMEWTEVEVDGSPKMMYRADPYNNDGPDPVLERNDAFGPVTPFPILASSNSTLATRVLSPREHESTSQFLLEDRDGRIFENKAPAWLRGVVPDEFRYAMVVPIFGVDQQPFALICSHTANKKKQYLEGYELQFTRAIGVILLSAMLRRRMVLADKAKSILISSVSHELRTPLHGILAAAELLSDTHLDQTQVSFLKTVTSCGNSLIETVNHVLDFTKLSGATQSSSGSSIKLSKVNLATLVEQTVEGSWVGQRARTFMGDSEIGSYYAPNTPSLVPKSQRMLGALEQQQHVETVIDIAHREKGWNVRCEKGGLRRVLMNLVGNSLKFTKDGYLQVTLRELPHEPGSKTIPIELAVIDTGKGIGKEFLKEQLFQPFSQENPLQTGTGLGLAIVNSIIRSEQVNGKVDVWSSEGMGTEIRITLDVEVIDDVDDSTSSISTVSSSAPFGRNISVAMTGFDLQHRGQSLSLDVLSSYACSWSFDITDDKAEGDIIIINELESLIEDPVGRGDPVSTWKPVIFLNSFRRSAVTAVSDKVNKAGGFFHILYKPLGPSSLRHALQMAVNWLERDPSDRDVTSTAPVTPNALHQTISNALGGGDSGPEGDVDRPGISRNSSGQSQESNSTISELSYKKFPRASRDRLPLTRRRSDETEASAPPARPRMAPRGVTYHNPIPPSLTTSTSHLEDDKSGSGGSPNDSSPSSAISTISLADGGVMLKAAAASASASPKLRVPRVMVVEDNVINRRVLGAFLKKRGYEWAEAHDGSAGVDVFASTPNNYWDVILMDISMPVMNGHEATRAIRKLEAERRQAQARGGLPDLSKLILNQGSAPPPPAGLPGVTVPVPTPAPAPARTPSLAMARSKIFALTGLATNDDKREAFSAGVDGYLVKPVSLASLDIVFKKLGF